MNTRKLTFLLVAALAPSCANKSDSANAVASNDRAPGDPAMAEERDRWDGKDMEKAADKPAAMRARGGDAMALDEGKMGGKGDGAGYGVVAAAAPTSPVNGEVSFRKSPPDHADKAEQKESGGEAATRAWFPETFLFEPLVVTDDSGDQTVSVRVPDRLTTWRILALAHSRSGAQGGAVTSFLGTLPTYVDSIVPKRLVIGDKVRLPIQLVNTTTAAVQSRLSIQAEHATITGPSGDGARTIPAQGSTVDYATLETKAAGTAMVRVGLGNTDAVARSIQVVPSGKPVTVTHSGTLAAPREVSLDGIAGADDATDHVRLMAFPGALALLRSELAVSTARSGVADDAYALLLAGRAKVLLESLGDKADPEVVRNMSILAGQRAMRDARTLDVTNASVLVEAALAHPDNPVLARLGERAADYLAKSQRPDGTFAGGDGWTLQRVLVASADATRAVDSAKGSLTGKQRAQNVSTKAAGAFERNLDHVEDGYTAAAILASNAVTGEARTKLRKLVTDHLKASVDGSKYLDVGDGVVRADGVVPSRALATALAVLALADDKAAVADLGGTLLGSYDPERGWGDGVDNLACMQAILALFKEPVPANVKITLEMDGKPVVEGTLSAERLKDVLVLDAAAPGLSGKHQWKIVSEPAVPGLGYSLTMQAWVPWDKEVEHGGLELSVPTAVAGKVGKPSDITVEAVAPSGMALHIEQSLPAGVQADRPSVQALMDGGTIARFELADGKVEMWINPMQPGQTFKASYRVIPTLAGTMHALASTIDAPGVAGAVFHVPPSEWTIAE